MEELDLKELISIFMKRKVLIIMVVIIFALVGAIYTLKFITPLYESFTTLVLRQTGTENNLPGVDTSSITTADLTLNSKISGSYIEIATSEDKVLSRVIENLNLDMTVSQLKSIIKVTEKTDTSILKITVEHTEPEQACKIANEVAKVFVEAVEETYNLNNLSVLDTAKVPQGPSNIHLAKNVLIFAFVGGILVSGYILLINMLDTTVKSDLDIERAINVPVLASIVLTNDNIKKSTHVHADSIYTMASIDNADNSDVEEPETTDNNDGLFENPNNEESDDDEYENTEAIKNIINHPNISNNNKVKPRKKNRNRRNNK